MFNAPKSLAAPTFATQRISVVSLAPKPRANTPGGTSLASEAEITAPSFNPPQLMPGFDRLTKSDAPTLIIMNDTPLITSVAKPAQLPLALAGQAFALPVADYLNIDRLPPGVNVSFSTPDGEPVDWVRFDRESQAFVGNIPLELDELPKLRVLAFDNEFGGAAFTINFDEPLQQEEQEEQEEQVADVSTVVVRSQAVSNAPRVTGVTGVTNAASISVVVNNTVKIPGFLSVEALKLPGFVAGSRFTFEVPKGTFTHENNSEPLKFRATLADGSPLPSWIVFNAETQTFSGEAPEGEEQELDVVVTAIDSASQEAQVQMRVKID